jgi:hypothetical protein
MVTQGDITAFVLTIGNLYFLFAFNLLYGNYIYEDFRVCSIYVFSRLSNRKIWYYRKLFSLLRVAALYHLLLILMYDMIAIAQSERDPDFNLLPVSVYVLCALSLIALISTALVSLIALKTGITTAFLIVYSLEVIFLFCLLLPQKLKWVAVLNYFNPLGGIVGVFEFDLRALLYLMYLGALFIILLVAGGRYISKVDIALEDIEVA